MERKQSGSDFSNHRGRGSFSVLVTSTLLSGALVMNKVKEESINSLQQEEPIETQGKDMAIYTKAKDYIYHIFSKSQDDKPQVIASSEDK